MIQTLAKAYRHGTHRSIAPEQTLANIAPHLAALGVARLADVTGLDSIGIPVYCAIRPSAKSLQVSNGKGLSHADAKVSALMEAVETHHFENPGGNLKRGSLRSMQRDGHVVIAPESLPGYMFIVFFSAVRLLYWVNPQDLLSCPTLRLPDSAS